MKVLRDLPSRKVEHLSNLKGFEPNERRKLSTIFQYASLVRRDLLEKRVGRYQRGATAVRVRPPA